MANTDTWAFFALFCFFFSLGILLPFINDAFSAPGVEHDTSGLPSNEDDLTTDSVGILEILLSVLTVFFWTFGQVNFFVDFLILLPLRILAVYLFARMIRGN